MKKSIALILVLCLYLSGCSLVPGNIQQAGDTQTSTQDSKSANNQSTQDKTNTQSKDTTKKDVEAAVSEADNSKSQVDAIKSSDASVEALLHLCEDFLDAAFAGDVDDMIGLCSNTLADDIEKNPKKFIGTKTDYNIDKVDTSIKALGESKYLLMSIVSAAKKSDKEKKLYDFKYSATVEKVKGDYYIIDFKRDSK